jgi:hypothetical protein
MDTSPASPERLDQLGRVAPLGAGPDDRERAAAQSEGVVEAVHHASQPLRHLEEHAVRGDHPDPGVQPREAVDVGHEQREGMVG